MIPLGIYSLKRLLCSHELAVGVLFICKLAHELLDIHTNTWRTHQYEFTYEALSVFAIKPGKIIKILLFLFFRVFAFLSHLYAIQFALIFPVYSDCECHRASFKLNNIFALFFQLFFFRNSLCCCYCHLFLILLRWLALFIIDAYNKQQNTHIY